MRTRLPFGLLPLLAACGQDYDVIAKPVDVDPGDITECAFTRVEDTAFYRYDCNPVFSTTGEDWAYTIRQTAFHVTTVLGQPFYQLWYTGEPKDVTENVREFGLGYAISSDGTNWEAHPDNPLLRDPGQDEWDADAMDGMQIIWDPKEERYINLYQGYSLPVSADSPWGMGVATSPDGVQWKRIAANPVFNLSDPVDDVRGWCWPLGLSLGDVAGYTGYVAGVTGTGMNDKCEVFRINGSAPDDWTPDSTRVLAAGEGNEWDDQGFISLAVAKIGDAVGMFYVGFGDWVIGDGYQSADHAFLGMAHVNSDGKWERNGDYIPGISMTEHGRISSVAANVVGPRVHLWITDEYCLKEGHTVDEGEDCDDMSAVGYFLYDPDKAAAEDGG